MANTLSVQVIEETCCLVASALGYPLLTDEQKTVLTNFILGSDVFAMQYCPQDLESDGKSLCYACLPCVFESLLGTTNSIVIVIIPLTSMKEQVNNTCRDALLHRFRFS